MIGKKKYSNVIFIFEDINDLFLKTIESLQDVEVIILIFQNYWMRCFFL